MHTIGGILLARLACFFELSTIFSMWYVHVFKGGRVLMYSLVVLLDGVQFERSYEIPRRTGGI